MSQRCIKCRETKPLTDFYTHPQMASGHLGKCKDCCTAYARRKRRVDDTVRERDRIRSKTPARRAHNARNTARHNRLNPEKYHARIAVNNAVRDGKLKRKPCEVCGNHKVHAHHDDYSKPLRVRWRCAKHHARLHAKRNRK